MSNLSPGNSIKINKSRTKKIMKAIQFAVKAPKKFSDVERLQFLSSLSDSNLRSESSKINESDRKSLLKTLENLNQLKPYLE
jgi:uncharacterized protein YecE (DUF72 family)